MLIAVKNPGEPLKYMVILKTTLEFLQGLVLGYIETFQTPELHKQNIIAIINEEGKLHGMPVNFWVKGDAIVGPAVFVSGDDDDFGGLNDEQVKYLESQLGKEQKLYREGWQEVK